MAKFDWYQATIPEDPTSVATALKDRLDGCYDIRTCEKGGNGYLRSMDFIDRRGGQLGRLLFGGNSHPNFRAMSHHAPSAARAIRETWPEHRVTRLDVAIDYTGNGAFEALHRTAHGVAERNRLKSGLLFQPDLLDRGRTYRIGSPTSPVMVRLYEKGLHEATSRGHMQDPTWTRLELQVRPQKSAKAAFAKIDPMEAWGATRWTAQLIEAVLGEEPARIDVDPRRETEWERTQASLVQQYGRHAISGGFRAAGGPEGRITTEDAVEAYLAILRRDLLDHVKGRNSTPKRAPGSRADGIRQVISKNRGDVSS